ncbi:MAG: hypothetical protein ACOY90_09870 [Candidatus Zhuqueibacterota bacterium]
MNEVERLQGLATNTSQRDLLCLSRRWIALAPSAIHFEIRGAIHNV